MNEELPELTSELIDDLMDQDMTKKQIAERYEITPRKVGVIHKAGSAEQPLVVTQPEAFSGFFSPDEYQERCKQREVEWGGRKEGEVTHYFIETLRVWINAGWSPSMVMKRNGYTPEMLQAWLDELSGLEMRDKRMIVNTRADVFQFAR